jgi:diketogulonate reductase-like aldo/keto reductase
MYPGGPIDPVLQTIARRIGGTPGQVIFKWAHAKGFVVVTTTAKPARMDEYLSVFHLRASPTLFTILPYSSFHAKRKHSALMPSRPTPIILFV